MSETTLTWSVENMVTITLMAFLGFALVGIVGQLIRRRANGNG
jgi:hypothetical protein